MSIDNLHLPELSVNGFRGVDQLSIPRLGRVTLLAGKNSVGKTTVLDAVRVYAGRGRYSVLSELLRDRQELTDITDEDGDPIALDWMSLFHGRNPNKRTEISIGPANIEDRLRINIIDDPQEELFPDHLGDNMGLKVAFREYDQSLLDLSYNGRYRYSRSRRLTREDEPLPAIACEYLGPGMLSERNTSRLWDSVPLTLSLIHI